MRNDHVIFGIGLLFGLLMFLSLFVGDMPMFCAYGMMGTGLIVLAIVLKDYNTRLRRKMNNRGHDENGNSLF